MKLSGIAAVFGALAVSRSSARIVEMKRVIILRQNANTQSFKILSADRRDEAAKLSCNGHKIRRFKILSADRRDEARGDTSPLENQICFKILSADRRDEAAF